MRVPVGEAFAAINEALVVHFDKGFDHRIVEVAVWLIVGRAGGTGHGEGVAGPVAGIAEAFHLAHDGGAILLLPLPDLAKEVFTAQVRALLAFFGFEFFFNLQLGRNARVVLSRLPKRIEAAHAVPTDEEVLNVVVERVTHVQRACDIWRRQHHRKAFLAGFIGTRFKGPSLFPSLVNPCLCLLGVKGLFHRHRFGPLVHHKSCLV